VAVWYEGLIPAGASRPGGLAAEWARAEVVVVLASPDFMARGLDDAPGLCGAIAAGKLVVPVRVRPSDLSDTRLAGLQALPRTGPELRRRSEDNRESAWMEIATEVKSLAARMRAEAIFVGREAEREEILRAVDRGQATQLLGLPKMGKTALLRWAERTLRTLGKPVVFLNARGLEGCSAIHVVRAVAETIGKSREVNAALRGRSALPGIREAAEVLPLLAASCWLVDDADALATYGHGFDKVFFDVLRSLGQVQDLNQRVVWISASETDMYGRFHATGLTSQFLNSASKVHVGRLTKGDVLDWLGRFGVKEESALAAWDLTGGCPQALEWVIEHRGNGGKDDDAIAEMLGTWMRPLFEGWWRTLGADDKRCLKALGGGTLVKDDAAIQSLLDRGLLLEQKNTLTVAGAVWGRFVQGV